MSYKDLLLSYYLETELSSAFIGSPEEVEIVTYTDNLAIAVQGQDHLEREMYARKTQSVVSNRMVKPDLELVPEEEANPVCCKKKN